MLVPTSKNSGERNTRPKVENKTSNDRFIDSCSGPMLRIVGYSRRFAKQHPASAIRDQLRGDTDALEELVDGFFASKANAIVIYYDPPTG